MNPNCSEAQEEDFNIIETALKDYENLKLKHRSMQDAVLDDFKKLKAFEIIKKKDVNITWIKDSQNMSEYNSWFLGERLEKRYYLTQEEYELLKEVLL